MRFGDYIRDIRRNVRWTQPQAAKEIGIEQSYLSKLESGKAYPSEDVFTSLMTAYQINLDDLSGKVFPADLDRLREIGQVRSVILKAESDTRRKVRNWIMSGVVSLSLGGACLGATLIAEDREITLHQYKSEAVIPDIANADAEPMESVDRQRAQDRQNSSELYRSLEDYKGVFFTETVPDGIREWRFFGAKTQTTRSPLRWLMVPAIALIFGGFGCFFASYRSA